MDMKELFAFGNPMATTVRLGYRLRLFTRWNEHTVSFRSVTEASKD
jgi:hypothetical protein